jgi:hypothetical protein
MRRRDFIAYGSVAALTASFVKLQMDQQADAAIPVLNLELHMEEIWEEMIDGEVIYAMAFRDPVTRALRPPLRMRHGQTVNIKLVNETRKPRRFAITGYNDQAFPMIPPGATTTISFVASWPGSYIYYENSEGAVGRVVGLHGPLVITGSNCKTPGGTDTPYHWSKLTPEVSMLFDAMGVYDRFPGNKWIPTDPERDKIWLLGEIDPAINRAAEQLVDNIDLSSSFYFFRPRYFTINGLAGYDAAHDPATVPKGYIGEPTLIRTMNAGLCTHAPHIHGNHIFSISDSTGRDVDGRGKGYCVSNVIEMDTWLIKPMARKDVLLPFEKPQEIPAAAWPPKEEPFPLLYPMHCHLEMSQTARGGQYPQGMVTHWELLGVKRGVAV